MKNKLIIGLIVLPFLVKAQHYDHTTFWGKIIANTPLSKKWDFQFEYVHRSQNDYHISKINPLSKESLEELRAWFYYKRNNFTLQFNPVTYIYSKILLGKEADYFLKPNIEWRSTMGLVVKQNVSKWTFQERIQYDYRWMKILNYKPIGRVRLRGTIQYAVTDKTKLQCFEEVFLNALPHKLKNDFDQNWALIGIVHQLTPKIALDIGYMRNHKKRPNGVEFDEENAISLGLNFRL